MNNPKGKKAWSVTVGSKGQFVIPKEAREMFDIHPGDTLLLLGDSKRGLAVPPKSTYTTLFSHVFTSVAEEAAEEE